MSLLTYRVEHLPAADLETLGKLETICSASAMLCGYQYTEKLAVRPCSLMKREFHAVHEKDGEKQLFLCSLRLVNSGDPRDQRSAIGCR